MMKIEESYKFAHSFYVEILTDIYSGQNDIQHLLFSRHDSITGDEVSIKVYPDQGSPWIGTFEPGYVPSNAISAILSMPDPNSLCVIAKGQGYVIDTNSPTSFTEIPSFPLHTVLAMDDIGVMLFADFTNISAYGAQGFLWRSHELSYDGLTVTADNGQVKAIGWYAPTNSDVTTILDARTGEIISGEPAI